MEKIYYDTLYHLRWNLFGHRGNWRRSSSEYWDLHHRIIIGGFFLLFFCLHAFWDLSIHVWAAFKIGWLSWSKRLVRRSCWWPVGARHASIPMKPFVLHVLHVRLPSERLNRMFTMVIAHSCCLVMRIWIRHQEVLKENRLWELERDAVE